MSPVKHCHTLFLFTVLHATVDGLCACCLFLFEPALGSAGVIALFVAYNVLAFMTQPLAGLWVDIHSQQKKLLLLAIAMLAIGGILITLLPQSSFAPLLFPITLLGLGNSLFHVYGGKQIALQSGNDYRDLGIFVSSGALGIYLGRLFASPSTILLLIALLVGLAILAHTQKCHILHDTMQKEAVPKTLRQWFVALLVFIVLLRSYFGQLSPFQSADIPHYVFWGVMIAVFGKAMGGFLSQRWAASSLLLFLLLTAGIAFLLSFYHACFALLFALLLNLTMPLTLGLANRAMPGREGLAFGLLAFVLAPGVLLASMTNGHSQIFLMLFALVATLFVETVVLLVMGERRWQVLGLSAILNVLTNLPLNFLYLFVFDGDASIGLIFVMEAVVVLIEGCFYLWVTHSWRRAVLYSLVCNVCSYAVGLLWGMVQMSFGLI